MSKVRLQYHFRNTENGLDAWNVTRLIDLSKDLPVKMINPSAIAELRTNHWYFHGSSVPSPQSIIEHIQLIMACDLAHPIILDKQGRVMDGMHRICKAIIDNVTEIPAVQFTTDPEPDYTNCNSEELPYNT